GCGRGAGAALILEHFRPRLLHAMDLDRDMIRRSEKHLRPAVRERLSFFAGDALHLPYRDATMDAVFGFGVLHHVPQWQDALREIARVLRPGGAYFLEEIYPHIYQNFLTRHILLHPRENRFFSHDLRAALAETGFVAKGTLEARRVGMLGIFLKNGAGERPARRSAGVGGTP
ncbi:MAG: class I SAM-dependent methyltransferase, partial [Proteobacteria bacterium]|nr:class I SAM-dependent methyltransferase [Pseudomonadota bacterium]